MNAFGRLVLFVILAASPWQLSAEVPDLEEIPILTWQAPLFWSPRPSPVEPSNPESRLPVRSSRIALTTTPPLPFIAITPCRQYDSRSTTPLANNTPRAVTLSGAPCGIPASAQAIAVNITVFNITGAGGNGVFKAGSVSPPTTAWINYPPTETQRGNAGVLPLDTGGLVYVQVNQGGGSVNFTVDVFGYYVPEKTTPVKFIIALVGIFPSPISGGAGPDPYVGEIRMFAGNFAPNGWASCDGQLLPISGNAVLFFLLGTTYGGDGSTTFALPNLNGSVPTGY